MISPQILILLLIASLSAEVFDGQDTNYGDMHKTTQYFKDHAKINIKDEIHSTIAEDVYYFFSMHDYNKDLHLDGHELRLAYLGYEVAEDKSTVEDPSPSEMETYIDHSLLEDDKNNDGKVSWEEFLESQYYHRNLDEAS